MVLEFRSEIWAGDLKNGGPIHVEMEFKAMGLDKITKERGLRSKTWSLPH